MLRIELTEIYNQYTDLPCGYRVTVLEGEHQIIDLAEAADLETLFYWLEVERDYVCEYPEEFMPFLENA